MFNRFMACAAVVGALAMSAAGQNTATGGQVVLQQGVSPTNGYTGCVTATLWPNKPAQAPAEGDKVLYLRGENNRMLLKFDLPDGLKGRPLVRASLWVFVPSARNMNRYCEILCHGMLGPWDASADWTQASAGRKWQQAGGDFDHLTDCHNGRPAGAVDSCELYAPNHNYWYNLMDWLTAGVPEGGLWLSFNVTPLAERWLADPVANYGLMLRPVRVEDERMPNNWEIDIPSPAHPNAKVRPRLELQFGPPGEPVQVGMTHTLRKHDPWSARYMYRGEYNRRYEMQMAAGEWEGFQVVVNPLLKDLSNVRFTWSDLRDPTTGASLPREDLAWYCQDVLKMVDSWVLRDKYFGGKKYHVPDPLVPAGLSPDAWRAVRRQQPKPFWFTVHAPRGTKPGRYATVITLTADGIEPVKLDLTVEVWDYEIPVAWNFATVGSFGAGGVQQFYGKDYKPEYMDRWYDFLLDHRLAPTAQYAQILSPPADRLESCIKRGMNVLYLDGNFKPNSNLNVLKERHDLITKMGYIDLAVVYVEDEGARHEMRQQLAMKRRQVAPQAMMLVGGAGPNERDIGYVDVWDPEIDVWPGDKLTAAEARKVVEQCQQRGERFFWYVAAGPTAPYPNVQLEYPLIGSRMFLWMSWKYRVTGFEYYCYNLWGYNTKGEKRWPEIPWDARAFVSRNSGYNCDGMLFYPGPKGTPCSSVRLENIRDGVEDWESFYLLRDYADALRAKGAPDAQAAALLQRAHALLDVPDEVVTSVARWSQDPDLLLKTRKQLGELIVAVKSRVTKQEYEKVRDARWADQLARQRRMLAERASQTTTATAPASAPGR